MYLFVYGTLLSRIKHPMYSVLASGANFMGKGYFQGKLFDLIQYPGVVASADPEDLVTGKIYLVHNLSILEQLDEYEGYNQNNIETSLFVRKSISIRQENGGTLLSGIYLYNLPTSLLTPIYPGDYYLYKQTYSTTPA